MNKTTLITGGSGFLGRMLSLKLLTDDPTTSIVLTDIVEPSSLQGEISFKKADLADPQACFDLITDDIHTIYHLASLVSGGAEQDFPAGFRANIQATVNLLEACRQKGVCARFIFPSSIATFGGDCLPEVVDDWTFQHPQNSYGVAKVIGEQLLNDYSRKGFISGRGIRLPAIVVRDEPNTAASGYVSAIIREPLAGRDYTCPVPKGTRIPILSIHRCVENLIKLSQVNDKDLGQYRTVNGPCIAPSALEIAEEIWQRTSGKISFVPDNSITLMIEKWPRNMRYERALTLGLSADNSLKEIVDDYSQVYN